MPADYVYGRGETLCDDGWLYRWGKRVAPWFVTLGVRRDWCADRRACDRVFRRDKLTIQRVERARWRAHTHMTKVLARYYEAVALVKASSEPFFINAAGRRVDLVLRRSFHSPGEWEVEQVERDKPETLVESIAHYPVVADPGYEVGELWRRTSHWVQGWWAKVSMLDRLFAIMAEWVIGQVVSPEQRLDRRFACKVQLLVNGRTYAFGPRQGQAPANHLGWPRPDDILIDTAALPPRLPRFHQAFIHFDKALKSPRARKKKPTAEKARRKKVKQRGAS